MKRNLIVLLFMLFILGSGIYLSITLKQSTENLLEVSQKAYFFCQQNDRAKSLSNLQSFQKEWKEKEPYLGLLLPQHEIAEISNLTSRLLVYLPLSAQDEFIFPAFQELNDKLEEMTGQFLPSVTNFL